MAGEDSREAAIWAADDSEQYTILSTRPVTPQQYSENANTNHTADATEYFSFKKVNRIVFASDSRLLTQF